MKNDFFCNYIKQNKDVQEIIIHSLLWYVILNYIYFLYNDCLMIISKLSTNVAQIENITMPYIDIFYHKTMSNLVLYTTKDIYKLNLDDEDKYIWQRIQNYIN